MNDPTTEIKELFSRFEAKDDRVHGAIREDITVVQSDVQGLQSALESFTLAGRILWAIGFLFLSSLGGVVGYLSAELNSLERQLTNLSAKQHAFEERGTKWGEQLDRETDQLNQDIRDIRKKMNGHYR